MKGGFAPWVCDSPATCREMHCARCGEHTGGQGDTIHGFRFDGKWYPTRIYFFCSEEDTKAALKEGYGSEPWIEEAVESLASKWRHDRRRDA